MRGSHISPQIAVARLDCPDNQKICEEFKVKSYPTIWLGTAQQIISRSTDGLTRIDPEQRTKEGVLSKMAAVLDTTLTDVPRSAADGRGNMGGSDEDSSKNHLEIANHVSGGASLNDIEGATIKSFQYLASPSMLQGLPAKGALLAWLQLLSVSHPIKRCRMGAVEALSTTASVVWDSGESASNPAALAAVAICGDSQFNDWTDCKGSKTNTRGYTCGLWLLFHSLAARMPENDPRAGERWLAGIRGYIQYFFQCSDCAKHFLSYATSPEASKVVTKRDAVLWIWRTHNVVNARLAKEDAVDGSGDPAYPHLQWPPQNVCASCTVGANSWNDDAVYSFLLLHYGGEAPLANNVEGGVTVVGVNISVRSSWGTALLLSAAVSGVVYASLKSNGQYAMRRSMSRLL